MVLRQGTRLGGRYEIEERIGAGGMAIVYRAKDKKLGRYVTVKVLREEFVPDEEFVSRFKIEAQAAAGLSNQNIVNIYDVGQDDNTHYIVMEYIDGITLKELIDDTAPFKTSTVIEYSLQIAQALQHAHKNNIVHRDIKSQNILVSSDGDVKVTDFGIAHATTAKTISVTGNAIGSVHYFSPEQARGGFVDNRGDIYSLGIVMYEMVTGKLPFDGDNPVTVAVKQVNEPLPDLSHVQTTTSLKNIILKATAKKPEERYQSADLLIEDLKQAHKNADGSFVQKIDIINSPTLEIPSHTTEYIRAEANSSRITESGYQDLLVTSGKRSDFTEDKRPKNREWVLVVGAVLTALIIIAILTVVGINYLNNKQASYSTTTEPIPVPVPGLLGLPFDDAKSIAEDLGFVIENTKSKPSLEYEEGTIMFQSPEKGEMLYAGSTINVNISEGPFKYEVPNLVGHMEGEIAGLFADTPSLIPVIKYVHSDTDVLGKIVSQSPDAETSVASGTEIIIYISDGPENKENIVPNVVGMPEEDAIKTLEELGFKYDKLLQPSNTVDIGQVIDQKVEAGLTKPHGYTVGLIISSGRIETTTEPTTTTTVTTTVTETTTTTTERQTTESTTEPHTVEEKPTTTKENETITMSFPVRAPDMPTGTTCLVTIVQLYKHTEVTIYNKDVSLESFPLPLSIDVMKGSVVRLFVDGNLIWEDIAE